MIEELLDYVEQSGIVKRNDNQGVNNSGIFIPNYINKIEENSNFLLIKQIFSLK